MLSAGLEPTDQDGSDAPLFAEINVTPFVDVMLVVLVIFMVAAPLMVHGLPVELPRIAAGTVGRAAKPLVVSVRRDGIIQVRTETMAVETLAARLDAIHRSEGDAAVYVRADRGVAYGAVADLLGKLGAAGFTRISLLTAPAQDLGAR